MEHDPTSITLDPNAGHITTINVYTVPPERGVEHGWRVELRLGIESRFWSAGACAVR